MLTHRFPYPPNRGDRIRSYNLLRVFAQKFRVTLAAIADEPVSAPQQKHVQRLCENVIVDHPGKLRRLWQGLNSLAHGNSITEGMFASPSLARKIHCLHQQDPFDAVFVFCSSMFPYVDRPAFENVRTVVDLVDVDSRKWDQMSRESGLPKNRIFRCESNRVRNLEQRIADRSNAITLVSTEEATLFRDTVRVPSSQIVRGVSNGVDTDFFQLPETISGSTKGKPLESNQRLGLVFTGVMNYAPNVSGMEWFCKEVLPKLQTRMDVSLKIVGRSPNTQAQALNKLPGVQVVGPVPDMRPFLTEADIAISPLKLARGIQNKVLEAMAMSRPVVCTTPSAQGIAAADGVHFVIADSAEQWCNAIVGLHANPSERQRIGDAARQLVESEYSWPARLGPLVELLNPNAEMKTEQPAISNRQSS